MATQVMEKQTKERYETEEKVEDNSVSLFIKDNITKPEGSFAVVKTVVLNKFYRVNFFKQKQSDCLVRTYDIVESKFIEIEGTYPNIKIIDITVKPKEDKKTTFFMS